MRSAEEGLRSKRRCMRWFRWIDICDTATCRKARSARRQRLGAAAGAPLGTRAEIKNLNSFRFLEARDRVRGSARSGFSKDGGKIVQETRLYDPDKDETRSMRIKEEAHDYRLLPRPGLTSP